MELIKLISSADARLEKMLQIYVDSFPADERRPIDGIMKLIDAGDEYNFFVGESDSQPIGFITVWMFDSFAYVEHFAVDSVQRGRNLGSQMMRQLRQLTDKPIILEIELLDEEGIDETEQNQRISRLRFYRRLGFVTCDRDYEQPPYSPDLQPVPLMLLEWSVASPLFPDKFEQVRDKIHSQAYGRSL